MHRISEVPFRNTTIEFHIESGVVLGVCRHSEIHVSGNANGGVSSTVYRWTEFSLHGIDGVERPHHFSSHGMFLRNGHRASLIHASCGKSHWAYIINHDTRLAYNPWESSQFVFSLGLVRYFSWWWFLAIVIGGTMPGLALFILFGAPLFLSLKFVQWVRAHLVWKGYLWQELERIKELLLASTERIPWQTAAQDRARGPNVAMPPLPPSHSMA